MRSFAGMTVYARTDRDPRQAMPLLRDEVRRVDPNLVVSEMRTLDSQRDMRQSNERMRASTQFGLCGMNR